MINYEWLTATGTEVLMVVVTGFGIFAALLFCTRVAGLRSFSKMSSFDFSITVAFGSILASTLVAKDPSLIVGCASLVVLYSIQYGVSKSRRVSKFVEKLIDNQPALLMAGNSFIQENLDSSRMTEADVMYKLREAGVSHPDQVFAVVLESTGDVSVVKNSEKVDPALFEGIKGNEYLELA